jgi:hypothetical protein
MSVYKLDKDHFISIKIEYNTIIIHKKKLI